MTDFRLELTTFDHRTVTLTECEGFVFKKERYTPYTFLNGTFIGYCDPAEVREVRFYCGSKYLLYGAADYLVCEHKNGRDLIHIRCYSFSKLLGQNYAEPGIISSPDLGTILNGRDIRGISYQSVTNTVNYVYINEKTTIWDAVRIYTMKAHDTHPFIYNNNTVQCTPMNQRTFVCPAASIVSYEKGQQLGNLLSDVYTQDLNDQWSYHLENSFATSHYIRRKKYYALDREWVYDLNDELRYHMRYADRGREFITFTRTGYGNEDLRDIESFTLPDGDHSLEISKLTITGSPKGIFTELGFYFDSYCNNT